MLIVVWQALTPQVAPVVPPPIAPVVAPPLAPPPITPPITPVAEPPGVLFSALANTPGVRDDVFAASEPEPPTEGESLTPKAANGSTRPPVSAAVMFS